MSNNTQIILKCHSELIIIYIVIFETNFYSLSVLIVYSFLSQSVRQMKPGFLSQFPTFRPIFTLHVVFILKCLNNIKCLVSYSNYVFNVFTVLGYNISFQWFPYNPLYLQSELPRTLRTCHMSQATINYLHFTRRLKQQVKASVEFNVRAFQNHII